MILYSCTLFVTCYTVPGGPRESDKKIKGYCKAKNPDLFLILQIIITQNKAGTPRSVNNNNNSEQGRDNNEPYQGQEYNTLATHHVYLGQSSGSICRIEANE